MLCGMTWFLKDPTWANLDSFKHFLFIGFRFYKRLSSDL